MLPISELQQQQRQLEQLHHQQTPEIPIPDLEQVEPQVGDGSLWTALYDYEAQGEDELTLRRGEIVVVLSTDSEVSGDVGWWTGKIGDKVMMPQKHTQKPPKLNPLSPTGWRLPQGLCHRRGPTANECLLRHWRHPAA